MTKEITTTVVSKRSVIGRKAMIFGASIIGVVIATFVAATRDPELTEITVVEETSEITVEIPDEEKN